MKNYILLFIIVACSLPTITLSVSPDKVPASALYAESKERQKQNRFSEPVIAPAPLIKLVTIKNEASKPQPKSCYITFCTNLFACLNRCTDCYKD